MPSLQHVLLVLIALTLVRLVSLYTSNVDLFFDEAQYWAWSRELSFGYFSKPPLLAWIIAGADVVCGSGEACVRAAAPVFYLGTSLFVYAIASELYDPQTAAWSALTFALGTALAFSARIISTDVPLLLCWAAALLAYVKLLRRPDWRWSVLLGIALGGGMLAKYAMIYFVLCAIVAAFLDRDARTLLGRPQTWAALAIAAAILSPNVYWNVANSFVTLKHTGDNITGGGLRLNAIKALWFFVTQFAVMGPFVFATFLVILVRGWKPQLAREDRLMLAFAVPPLALVFALSFVRNANANWAAPSVLAMTILAVAWWLRHGQWRWLWASLAIGVAAQTMFAIGDAYAYRITVPALGKHADVYRRTLGWRPLSSQVAGLARQAGVRTVVSDGRGEVAALIYYLRNEPVKVLSWPLSAEAQHHFELTRTLDRSAAEPLLMVSTCPLIGRIRRSYRDVSPLAHLASATGPTTQRTHATFRLSSPSGEIAPLGPCLPDPA